MSEKKFDKSGVITSYATNSGDTGSPEVQVSILTERITGLQEHFRTHAKDHASRRGLLLMVGQRNRLLKYLARTDRSVYQDLIKRLGLRK